MIDPDAIENLNDDELLNLVDDRLPSSPSPTELASMPSSVRAFCMLRDLEFELTMGGLVTYFSNSAGQNAAVAVTALRRIRADRCAQLLESAIPLGHDFRDRIPSRSEFEVSQPFPHLDHTERVDVLGRDLYTTLYVEDFGAKVAVYLREESDEVAAYLTDHPAPVRSNHLHGSPPTIGRS